MSDQTELERLKSAARAARDAAQEAVWGMKDFGVAP